MGIIEAPSRPCKRAEDDHAVDIPGQAAQHAAERETQGRAGEQPARGKHPRQPAGKRDHDDLGNQIGGLHPAEIWSCAADNPPPISCKEEATIWISSKAMNMPTHITAKGNIAFNGAGTPLVFDIGGDGKPWPQQAQLQTASPCSQIRTGTRCTIFVKLPVAFSAGRMLNTAPVAGARLPTWPVIFCARQHVGDDRHGFARLPYPPAGLP